MLRTFLATLLIAAAVNGQTFRLSEVSPNPDDALFDQMVEITNTGSVAGDLSTAELCVLDACLPLPSQVLGPGSAVRVHTLLSGTNTATDIFMPLFGTMDRSAGSITLRTAPPAPGDGGAPAQVLGFVQWGAPQLPLSGAAVAAGAWTSVAEFAPTPGTGESLAWSGQGNGPVEWFRDVSPTLGGPNLSPTAATETLFPACSPFAFAPSLTAPSAPALGNADFSIVLQSQLPMEPGLLVIGLGTARTAVPPGCTFFVDQVVLEIPLITDALGAFVLSATVPDLPVLVGTEIGLQAIIANAVAAPGFDMSNGLAVTF